MLKKALMLVVVGLCVSTFAIEMKKIDFTALTTEQIAEMKSYCANNKGRDAVACAIALYKQENANVDLTIEKMEEIAKKYAKKEVDVVNGVLVFVAKSNQYSKYGIQFTKYRKYATSVIFCNAVSRGLVKVDNANDYRVAFVRGSKSAKAIAKCVKLLIKDCQSLPESDAVKYLKQSYQAILPKLVDNAELKPAATELGLALRSYGVEVK